MGWLGYVRPYRTNQMSPDSTWTDRLTQRARHCEYPDRMGLPVQSAELVELIASHAATVGGIVDRPLFLVPPCMALTFLIVVRPVPRVLDDAKVGEAFPPLGVDRVPDSVPLRSGDFRLL